MPRLRTAVAGWITATLFLIVVAAPPEGARAGVFDPTTFTLDNGLQVVVVTNRRAPIVTQMLWYRVGAADDPRGKSGASHVLEHMMFKGTEAYPDGRFSELVAKVGGRENAFTSYDYTGYYQTVAREHLELIMKLEADRMTNLVLEPDDFRAERMVVLQERKQRVENSPAGELSEMASASLYLHHPYGNPVIGWAHELQSLTLDDLRQFYERWYAPDNAVLVIAGDVTAEAVRPLAEKYYGRIPAAEVAARQRVQEPEQSAPRRVTLESAQVEQPSLTLRYLAPSYRTDSENHAYALEVLSEILGGGPVSRLYRALVVEQKLAAAAGSWYRAEAWDRTTFSFYVNPRPDVAIETVEQALRAEIDELLQEGVTADEVADAKRRLRANAVYARDDVQTAPRVLGEALVTGQSVADVEAWPERIGAVTPEQVEAAARAVLDPERSVTSVLLPEPTS